MKYDTFLGWKMSVYLPIFILVMEMSTSMSKLTNLQDISYYEIVQPRHLDALGRNKRDISTFNHEDMQHLEETTFTFFGHGRYFHLKIYKNRFLIPDRFMNIYQNPDASYHYDNRIEHCYYHGYLANRRESFAAISTCYGLKGVIRDEDREEFLIEPHPSNDTNIKNNPNTHQYIMFKSRDVLNMDNNAACGVSDIYHEPGRTNDYSDSIHLQPSHHTIGRVRRSNIDVKHVEVVVVLDNLMFKAHGESVNATLHRGLEIFNMVDHVYKAMNTRVAVVNMVVWNVVNMATVSTNAGETLSAIEKYTRDVMHGEMRLSFDNAQLISTQYWGNLVGLAGVGVICTLTSAAINRDHNPNPSITGNTVAHELGHNIGFMHNTNSCVCNDGPCVMSSNVAFTPCKGFTNCSQNEYAKRLAKGELPCLLDFPGKLFGEPRCGNGYVEEGEECDCGTKLECQRLNLDRCCNYTTCRLRESAKCATGACCDQCMFKKRGVLCRRKHNDDCDLEEFCTGKSGNCPKNFHRRDGASCRNNTAYCYQGSCKTHDDQCKMLWGDNAVKANDVCFQTNRREGNAWGNCGKNLRDDYVKCAKKDELCGKLQCTSKSSEHPLPKYPIIGRDRRRSLVTFTRGKEKIICVLGATTVSHDLQDPTMTNAGVKCGNNSICVDHKCTPMSSLSHIVKCDEKCLHAGGVCNNNGNCHCPKGYACPYCEVAGPGGSADSGQGCILDEICENCFTVLATGMLVLFLVVVPLIVSISYVLYRNRLWLRLKCGSRHENESVQTECIGGKVLSPDFECELGHFSRSLHPFITDPQSKGTPFYKGPPPIPP